MDDKLADRMRANDILNIDADTPAEIVEDLDAYFHSFANPKNSDGKSVCMNCGQPIDGMMSALCVGVAYRWGLVHGEANCSGCGWPARGMHYIKDRHGEDLISIRNLFLPYHPDEVSSCAQSEED